MLFCYWSDQIFTKKGVPICANRKFLSGRTWEKFWTSTGYWSKNNNPTVFLNLALMITLFICKGRLLILQEMQELNIKIKEQPHGMMLTTSFFLKEKRNNYTLPTYIYIRRKIFTKNDFREINFCVDLFLCMEILPFFFFCADGQVLIILWWSMFVDIGKWKYRKTEKSAKHIN